ncbi:uncharacterized protein NPIL_150761 [Nephila pilipes]|uniref:Uncharacterized protein n=1 Tax=Nephila pilipes TaxID=299642 RepID=A0A8X6NKA8_NEPPI|nr:uncharacterized protein NPIL_150761 [Nephila pilipes]
MTNKGKSRSVVKRRHSKRHYLSPRSQSKHQNFRTFQSPNVMHYSTEPSQNSDEELKSYLRYQYAITKTQERSDKFVFLREGWMKRALNIAGFLCILIGCLYQSCSFLSLYLMFPTTMELNVTNEAVLDFPAVTVCNSNPVRYRMWCKEDPFACIRKPNETLEDISKRLEYLYDKLSRDRRIRLGNQFEEFVIYAEYVDYEEDIVMDEFDWYYDYEFTNCYTFNALWGNRNKDLRKAVLFNPITGKSSELILCVNIDVNNYSNLSGSVVGRVMMTIHSNDIVPNPTYDAASLEAGKFYSYGIQKVTTELLKYPYQTRCRNYDEEKEIRTGARMSQKVIYIRHSFNILCFRVT